MRPAIFFVLLLGCTSAALAQQWSPFKNLRYDEHYALLANDTIHHTLYATLKVASVRKAILSLGGEGRAQFYKIENEDWGETPESSDGFLLSRFLLHLNVNAGAKIRLFTQLQGGHAYGKKSVSPVDQNQLDLHQVFLDYTIRTFDTVRQFTLRVGRQELLYGSQRLVSVREGPNYRQSFDGVKFILQCWQQSIDIFYTHYVTAQKGVFNDAPSGNVRLWGLYVAHRHIRSIQCVDLYYFGYTRRDAGFQAAQGRELRHSFGVRLWNISSRFSYDAEVVLQTGRISGQTIFANTASLAAALTWPHISLKPQLGLKTEFVSGDRGPNDDILGTFNAMFPRGAYFGLAALFGPQNIMDIHPSLTLSFSPALAMTLEYDAFWRHAVTDGLYTTTGDMIYAGYPHEGRFIGDQSSCSFVFTPSIFITCALELKWFNTGSFLKEAGPGKDILFGMAQVQFKF
jgi:hypothetical protein